MVRHPIWLSLAFFLYSVFVAAKGDWQAGDIVWSMWIASLVGGYAYIVLSVFSGMSFNAKSLRDNLFLLFFFTAHFGGFHFVHGQIMQGFFPLAGADVSFLDSIKLTLQEYWQFVLVALANLWPQFSHVVGGSNEGRRLDEKQMQQAQDSELFSAAEPPRKARRSHFQEPYKAVVRNHIMIIAVAFISQLVSQPQLLYLLLVFYFFPFSDLLAMLKRRREGSS